MEVDESSDSANNLPENITRTENASYTFSSTTSACLDFYFEVFQNTGKEDIVESLKKAWDENASLTLKLIFQLRDVRNGKAALVEFHHCLTWLFYNHPLTLIYNLEFVAQHGYWKDLSWLIKFLVEDNVSVSTQRQCCMRNTGQVENSSRNDTLEDLIRKRVEGLVSKKVWIQHLNSLPDDKSRNEARKKFQDMSQEIHLAKSKEAKTKKKAAKSEAVIKMSNFKISHPHFTTLYDKTVSLFSSALKRDKDALVKEKRLTTTALAGKWAPSIGSSIDLHTSLGKNIARSLYASIRQKNADEAETDYDKQAFINYRKEYLTPLRASINVPERLMSKRKWSDVEYERVPSVCMKRNKKLFLKKDPERFGQYLEDVKSGKKKIASGALLPHQIVDELTKSSDSSELLSVAELQWNDYVENLKKSGLFESALSVCDVSGSMSGEPMQVAIALSLLTAALSKHPFNNYICTFSATPSLQKIDQPTLKEKVSFVQEMDWGMNTEVQVQPFCLTSMYKL